MAAILSLPQCVNQFFLYEYYFILIKLTLRLKQNCDDFVLWLNSHGSRNKNSHHFAHVIFNRISCREIAVFWLYKFALRLKENRNHIADDNFQSTILVWVLLYFYLKKVTLRPRWKWSSFFRWLGAVGIRIIDCPLSAIGNYNSVVDWSLLISTRVSPKSHGSV